MKTLVYRRNIDYRFYSVKLGDILLDIFGGGWNDTEPCLHRVTYFINNGFLAQLLLERLACVIIIPPNQILLLNMLFISLPSATVVAERLCFHKRLSFCPGGEVYTSRADTFLDTPPQHTHTRTHPRRPLQQTVCILLECILVKYVIKNVHDGTLLTALTTLMTRSREISCSFCH